MEDELVVLLSHTQTDRQNHIERNPGRVKLLSAAGSKKVFAISKWRMASNVKIFLITVSTKNTIFRQLSLIPYGSATGSAEQLNSPQYQRVSPPFSSFTWRR